MKSSERVLDVLVAGAATPDPAELLESHAMDIVLDELKSIYDLVVVDTPPLTMASDVFSLLTKVNGVIIVARMGRIRRPDAEKLQSMLSIINTPVLGAVANTTKLSGQSKRHGGAQQAMPIRSESPAEWFSAAKS
jgi:Mrp family chromosome partitioning ATPase